MELGHLLAHSGLTYPEVSSKVYYDSFCQLGSSISLPWVIDFEAFYLHVVSRCIQSPQITIFRFCNKPPSITTKSKHFAHSLSHFPCYTKLSTQLHIVKNSFRYKILNLLTASLRFPTESSMGDLTLTF